MTTLTEIVAAMVVHSSAVALSHFGVAMAPVQADHAPPVVERVVAKTPRRVERLSGCPSQPLPHEPIPILKV